MDMNILRKMLRNAEACLSMKKMIIVSPETHTSLFLLKLKMQKHNEGSVTFREVIDRLIEEHYKIYKMEEKE